MNWKEFREWLGKHDMTNGDAAEKFGVSIAAVHLWRTNNAIPRWIVKHIETIEGKGNA